MLNQRLVLRTGGVALVGVLVVASQLLAVSVPNMFAIPACAPPFDPDLCPAGVWDQAEFDQMFLDPAAYPAHYPSGQTGAYTRAVVPLCEEEPCAEDIIRCADGTRPLFYFKPGSGADADKWVIKIQGGGLECAGGRCLGAYLTGDRDHLGSAHGMNGDKKNAQGLLSTVPPPRNAFGNYTTVFLDKCVGDRNQGDATLPDDEYAPDILPGVTGPLYFHGFRIIKGLLQALKDLPGTLPDLQDAELVAFMANSNGSNGAYSYMDRLSAYVQSDIAAPGNEPDVRLLASSYNPPNPEIEFALLATGARRGDSGRRTPSLDSLGAVDYLEAFGHVDEATTSSTACGEIFDPDAPSYLDWMDNGLQEDGPTQCRHGVGNDHPRGIGSMFFSPAHYDWGYEFDSLSNWGAIDATPTVDASCLAAHMPTGDLAACNDSVHIAIYHLTTPTFFAFQTADRNIRTDGRGWTKVFDPLQCDPGDPNCHSENFRGEVDGQGEPIPSSGAWHKDDFRQRALLLADQIFGGSSPHQEPPGAVGHGAFVDNSVDHMGFAQFIKLRRPMKAAAGAPARELQHYLLQWLHPNNVQPVVCVDDGQLFDVELEPPVPFADAPPGLECDSGFYQGADPDLTDDQPCLDPYANTAMEAYSCPVVDMIFADGFETGDVSSWSTVVP